MISLTLALLLPLAPLPDPATPRPTVLVQEEDDEQPELTREQIKAAVEALEAAFEKDVQVPERIDAIRAAAAFPHEDIARALRDGLGDKDLEVVRATLVVLAQMEVEQALDELVRFYKKDKRLEKDDQLFAETLRAVAYRGDPSTLDLLMDNIFKNTSNLVVKARIYGIARCRTPEAVEALMTAMKSAGKHKIQPIMEDLRVGLAVLTGDDNGSSQDRWIQWWGDNKRDLSVSATPPKINAGLQRKWDAFWALDTGERQRKKERDQGGRGGDGGDDPKGSGDGA